LKHILYISTKKNLVTNTIHIHHHLIRNQFSNVSREEQKTTDTNSAFFAKYCFSLGIDLKRIEVIADDESEIIEAATRMSKNYDFVITSGGIGPT